MRKLLLAATMFVALVGNANAGDNSCYGIVTAGKIDDCTFVVNSSVGRKILQTCPIGSKCEVALDLGASRKAIKLRDIDWIEGPQDFIRLH